MKSKDKGFGVYIKELSPWFWVMGSSVCIRFYLLLIHALACASLRSMLAAPDFIADTKKKSPGLNKPGL